jgi:hypothetical protein
MESPQGSPLNGTNGKAGKVYRGGTLRGVFSLQTLDSRYNEGRIRLAILPLFFSFGSTSCEFWLPEVVAS